MLNLFKKAQQGKYAIGAFNISNLEQLKGIVQAAEKMQSPLLIATSEGESNFLGKAQAKSLIDVYRKETKLPIWLHLDHGKSFEAIEEAIEAGYDSVHFDGSALDFEENISITKKVVVLARKHKLKNIEGEVGILRGSSALEQEAQTKEEDLTDPKQALEFVKKTKVDSLAISIGNIHGVAKSGKNPHLRIDRLIEIDKALNQKTFLVLHGGSGTPEEDILRAINNGIVKVNVNTELRAGYTQSLKKSLADNPDQTTPYKIMPGVIDKISEIVEDKIILFGSDYKI